MSKDVIECVCAFTLAACLTWVCLYVVALWLLVSSCITADLVSQAKDRVINTGKRLNGFLTYPRRGHPGWAVLTWGPGLWVLIPWVPAN